MDSCDLFIVNINTIDLNLLRVFAAIYGEHSVSRAAEALGMTQPAISNALMRLRRSVGDPLFVRTSNGMEPTALAVEIAGPIQQALALLKGSLEKPSRFDPASSERVFKLLMSDAGEAVILTKLMETLQQIAPRVALDAVQLPHAAYAQALEEGKADLAFGNLPFLRAGFYQQKLFSDPYLCIGRHGHPVIRDGAIKLAQFLVCGHVLVSGGNADSIVDKALVSRRLHRIVQLRLGSYHAALEIVRRTDLLAVVPFRSVGTSVQAVSLPFKVEQAEVRQFWHKRAHHDAANMWLRSLLSSLFATSSKVTTG